MKKHSYKLAAIDVGSNAMRLIVSEQNLTEPFCINEKNSHQIRIHMPIGVDVFSIGEISQQRCLFFVQAMEKFAQVCRDFQVEYLWACATSAMRDAKNKEELIREVERVCGIHLQIISGYEEAQITRGSYICPAGEETKENVFVDVGGGSTEVSVGNSKDVSFARSFQVGSMRKWSEEEKQFAFGELQSVLEKINVAENTKILATGGSIHAFLQIAAVNKQELGVEAMRTAYEKLSKLEPEQISLRYGIAMDRAKILVPAVEIFLLVADSLKINTVKATNMSLRLGLIRELREKLQICGHCEEYKFN